MSNFKNRSRSIAREQFWEKNNKETYQCPDCGRSEDQVVGSFEVHHINGEPLDNRPENQVGLCRLCHNLREEKKPSIESIEKLREADREPLAGETGKMIKKYWKMREDHMKAGPARFEGENLSERLEDVEAVCDLCANTFSGNLLTHHDIIKSEGVLFCPACDNAYNWLDVPADIDSSIDKSYLSPDDIGRARDLAVRTKSGVSSVDSLQDLNAGDAVLFNDRSEMSEAILELYRVLDVGPRGIFYCETGEIETGDELVEGTELRLDDTPPNSDHTLLEMIRWGYLYKRESDWWEEWLELC